MNRIILITLLSLSIKVNSQIIVPAFKSNFTHQDSLTHKKLLRLTSKNDITITLVRSGFWLSSTKNQVLGFRKGKWSQIEFSTNYKNNKSKTKIIRPKVEPIKCDSA